MGREVVKDEVRSHVTVRVLQSASQLDQELLQANYVACRSHHVLRLDQAVTDGSEKSDSAEKLFVLRSLHLRIGWLPSSSGLWPDLESCLIHVDDLIAQALVLKILQLASKLYALLLQPSLDGICDASILFRL